MISHQLTWNRRFRSVSPTFTKPCPQMWRGTRCAVSHQRNELKYREVICQSLIHQFKYQQIQMYLSFCQFTKYTVSSLEIFLHQLVCNELKWIHRNILQNWHRDGTVCSHVGADDLLKNMPSDLDKYVVGNNRHL
jgi:hypothetical protein